MQSRALWFVIIIKSVLFKTWMLVVAIEMINVELCRLLCTWLYHLAHLFKCRYWICLVAWIVTNRDRNLWIYSRIQIVRINFICTVWGISFILMKEILTCANGILLLQKPNKSCLIIWIWTTPDASTQVYKVILLHTVDLYVAVVVAQAIIYICSPCNLRQCRE